MKYICVQPALDYYTWQIEVMINNFMTNGINPNDIEIIMVHQGEIPPTWRKIADAYPYVRFFFYKDSRTDKRYIPSIYFNGMKQHLAAFPELNKEHALFVHDSDIIFTRTPDFKDMERDDVWYLSDTVGYIGAKYILSKGEDVYNQMCELMGMHPLIPKLMNGQSGGAQHIVKNTDAAYWDKVERDAIKMYQHFCDTEHLYQKKSEGDYPIQKWTAGMWSLLWNAWLRGFETRVDKRLDFCWATDGIKKWDEVAIFHNAGVVDARKKVLFFKGDFIDRSPYGLVDPETYSKEFCSYNYAKQIAQTATTSCLV